MKSEYSLPMTCLSPRCRLFTIKTRPLSTCRVNAFGILSLQPAMRATTKAVNTLLRTGIKVEYSFSASETYYLGLWNQNDKSINFHFRKMGVELFSSRHKRA